MNLEKSNILRLKEKGFGSTVKKGIHYGEATILCDGEGEPLFLRSVIFENGMIGGQLSIVKLSERLKSAKTDFNLKETVFEIKLTRNSGAMTGGGICVKQIDAINMNVNIFEIGYMYENEKPVSFVSGQNMQYSDTAKELLEGVLNKAFMAAINRSLDCNPKKLYYGKLATDVPPLKQREWVKESVKLIPVMVMA